MLGFTAFSEAPLSQATTSALALGFLASIASQGFVGTAGYAAEANTLFNSAVATSAVAIEFDAKAATSVLGVLSTVTINDLLDPDAQATVTPSAATVAFTTGVLDYDAKAFLTLNSATASIAAYDIADADAQARTTLSSTSAYLTIYITDFADEDAQAKAFMLPAVATTNVAIDYDAQGRSFPTTVFASTDISGIDFDAKANITTSTLSLTGVAEEPAYIWGNSRVYPTSLLGRFNLHLDAPIPNSFPYEDYADSYNPTRVLYILDYTGPGTETVYVEAENFTVTVDPIITSASDTVFIAQESFTVVISPYIDSSTTIFIDR